MLSVKWQPFCPGGDELMAFVSQPPVPGGDSPKKRPVVQNFDVVFIFVKLNNLMNKVAHDMIYLYDHVMPL